ncbi:LLM class F420-dependent oxidoreductase [Reyranella sp. CPCC 100927]|uniref:LLM class F420-dependent oxidoreductase n=1 Tax=Reyranella sp. CPCC 100927 TaxID=2599616 RepID=UPI0011B7D905|nr:LLM class F420-dependent oxidoreductase [Reyranella sp. CPCC 100927]TWS99423.1 LLM class F420-dependent oxidoreductase [Reyranella sp. CPCC 100927]
MHLDVAMPLGDIGGEPAVVREFAQIAEDTGYDGLSLPDHVLGSNPATATGRTTASSLYHDPFVLFAFIAASTTRAELSTQVLILPQRQTVLAAKQAASLAVLSGGRFRFGIGVGWNEVEFVGLNENFRNRGKRSEEQVTVMQALWSQPFVDVKGAWHTIPDAGINPRPPHGTIPLWFGGHMDVTLRRTAKWGDGWMMLAHPPGDDALAAFDTLRRYTAEEGRDPKSVGIEVWTSTATGAEAQWREEFLYWKKAGVTHITLHNAYGGYHHKRMAGRTMAEHVDALRRYHNAVADLL